VARIASRFNAVLAQIGPLTTLSETAATAIGAGVVLGSVVAGIGGLLFRRSKSEVESGALFGGYAGGAAGGFLALLDVALRYGVPK
jgi:hypothetical protein